MEEAHSSRYSINPGSTKMYRDLIEKGLGSKVNLSTAFHPQTDGQAERTIQTLEDMLRACFYYSVCQVHGVEAKPLTQYDPELSRTLRRMTSWVVNENAHVYGDNLLGDTLRVQNPPEPRLQDNYRVEFNAVESEGPIVLPPLPPGHTFVVTRSLMQMLTARGLFSGMALEDLHGHMAKLRSVCKSCVGRPELDMNFIGLRVLPLSLTSDVNVWFSELPYNYIHTWDQLHMVFMAKYFPLSKKLNHKDKLNNFVALLGESASSSWDRFTAFIKSVPNHRIDDEALKEYFYRGQDDNEKEIEFEVDDWVYLKVSPMKGVMRFEKNGKLSPRYIGPYRISKRVGNIAYELELPQELATVHSVFHVPMLKKCMGDP
ncbi:hypothetical protein MTR67_034290 [Solanum verrucosum]|uniref:Integrase catalytic domain-containing protein n=1 Tax=Solanum verrucosum TaxID=315347 RepID=A0AAF0U7Y0_SOLVR|nr:hypothetical protein MTR67_034290 [Solanum verrucosum]